MRTEQGKAPTATPSTTSISPYLAKMTKLNTAALEKIASAPPPPEPKVGGAVSTDTTLTWRLGGFEAVAFNSPLASNRCQPMGADDQSASTNADLRARGLIWSTVT